MANNRGGKGYRRGKKKPQTEGEMHYAAEGGNGYEKYGVIENTLGDRRFNVMCADTVSRVVTLPGKFWKKVWFNKGDIVCVNISPNPTEQAGEIVCKYTPDQVRRLKAAGLIEVNKDDIYEEDVLDENDMEDQVDDEMSKIEKDEKAKDDKAKKDALTEKYKINSLNRSIKRAGDRLTKQNKGEEDVTFADL